MGVTGRRVRRWSPIRVAADEGGAWVDWCRTDGLAFADPFVDQTLDAGFRHPARLLFQQRTSVRDLLDRPDAVPGAAEARPVPVEGMVLHLSRCGSTLVTRMLGDRPGTLALSEPGSFDPVLRWPAEVLGIDEAERPALVAALARAWCADDGTGVQRAVLKLDAWALVHHHVLRQAFPDVPSVVLGREPGEILASQRNHLGAHLLPGVIVEPRIVEATAAVEPGDLDGYGAAVLGCLAEAASEAVDLGGAIYVDYDDLPHAVGSTIAPHLGWSDDDIEAARPEWAARLAVNAKNEVLPFEDDRAAKAEVAAEPAIADAVARHARAPYDALAVRSAVRA